MSSRFWLAALIAPPALPALAGEAAGPQPQALVLDPAGPGRTFEGIGAVSAGASSRLLIDYPEPARSRILDLLFTPDAGAGFQHLKVEIGGDVNSTDGCEPSHMRRRDDENFTRGYEWWLMKEAKRRNPGLVLDALAWGAPGWIGGGAYYSQDMADYLVRFLRGAREVHGLEIGFVGVWNEVDFDAAWIKRLRRTLDREGLSGVKIVAADQYKNVWTIVNAMQADPELRDAVHAVGVHYPKFTSPPAARDCGKPLWSSEDGPWDGTGWGAAILARMYNRNYIVGRMTKTEIWSPVTSYYDCLPLPGSGVMRANEPWSGAFEIQPALWATAHTTSFASPGWVYLDGACVLLAGGGSCVALRAPAGGDYSVIVETSDAAARQEVTFRPAGGLSAAPLHVWRSDARESFVRLADVTPHDGAFTTAFDPGCIYSLTTLDRPAKESEASPPRRPFPAPYAEDFESYAPGATPRYFSDQGGIFEVAPRSDGKGRCLRHVLDREGIRWPHHANPAPETFVGDLGWMNYAVTVDALIENSGSVSLFGHVGNVPQQREKEPHGYRLRVNDAGRWELRTAAAVLASGRVAVAAGEWHTLGLEFEWTAVRASIDGTRVAEVEDATYAAGLAGVGCGWHGACFDNVTVRFPRAVPLDLARGRPARASSGRDPDRAASRAVDGEPGATWWMAADGKTAGEWLEVDLGAPVAFDAVVLRPYEARVGAFRIEVEAEGAWREAASGGPLGAAPRLFAFPPVTARRVRFTASAASKPPALREVEVYSRATGR